MENVLDNESNSVQQVFDSFGKENKKAREHEHQHFSNDVFTTKVNSTILCGVKYFKHLAN